VDRSWWICTEVYLFIFSLIESWEHSDLTGKEGLQKIFVQFSYQSPSLLDWFNYYTSRARHDRRLFAYLMRMNRLIGIYRYWDYLKNDVVKDLTGKNNWQYVWNSTFFFVNFQVPNQFLFPLGLPASLHFFWFSKLILLPASPSSSPVLPRSPNFINSRLGFVTRKLGLRKGSRRVCESMTGIQDQECVIAQVPFLELSGQIQGNGDTISGPEIYLFAFYYTATTSVGCGFGDFKPVSRLEQNITSLQLFTCTKPKLIKEFLTKKNV